MYTLICFTKGIYNVYIAFPGVTKEKAVSSLLIKQRSLSYADQILLENSVPVESLLRISHQIVHWRATAKALSLTERDIESINHDCQHQHEPFSEWPYQVLIKWHRCAEDTSYKVLVDALTECGETEAAKHTLDYMNTKQLPRQNTV